MLINYKLSEESADLFDLLRGREKVILFYRCFDNPMKDDDNSQTVRSFAVVEEDIEAESFIDAHFSSFTEAKSYYDFLCGKLTLK
ncbi:hypothetical protein [Edwardsiella piscicida]|uniref:hypothetical protein n=1 Tax=Edwardsiella piscicida TaxID=1263550 RepID=UPI00247A5DE3|nr:hypothetical protein [Edwardsiella piscicida]WGS75556.1 hypothetical protein PED68_09255 [Edwardsiella piscicida]WGS78945.1 hypothetical protein PED70_09260 [Edwardsiella piscicida]